MCTVKQEEPGWRCVSAWVRIGLACQNPCVNHALHFVAELGVFFVKFESDVFCCFFLDLIQGSGSLATRPRCWQTSFPIWCYATFFGSTQMLGL